MRLKPIRLVALALYEQNPTAPPPYGDGAPGVAPEEVFEPLPVPTEDDVLEGGTSVWMETNIWTRRSISVNQKSSIRTDPNKKKKILKRIILSKKGN
jgi:hypothetical protein